MGLSFNSPLHQNLLTTEMNKTKTSNKSISLERPSTCFTSPGRNEAIKISEELNLSFYPKRHQAKENSMSMLMYRKNTLKNQGKEHHMDKDLSRFH